MPAFIDPDGGSMGSVLIRRFLAAELHPARHLAFHSGNELFHPYVPYVAYVLFVPFFPFDTLLRASWASGYLNEFKNCPVK